MKIIHLSFFLLMIAFSSISAEDESSIEPYESFRDSNSETYDIQISRLENYLKNPDNIFYCREELLNNVGKNKTYKAYYNNGFEGIIKYHGDEWGLQYDSDSELINREVSAFSVAKELGFREIAPIVVMESHKKSGQKVCPLMYHGDYKTKLVISYVIKNSTHLTSENNPDLMKTQKRKYDWFNFLIFDCDHATHNILEANDKSYLIDFDWAFSYPSEIRKLVHVQPTFEDWCSDYISLYEKPKNTESPDFCKEVESLLDSRRAFIKLHDYTLEKFPESLNKLSAKRKDSFKARSNFIMNKLIKCNFYLK